MKGEEIEAIYKASLCGPFPYADCRVIAGIEGLSTEDLIPELDSYLSTLAGYSSSASRLLLRTAPELNQARVLLSKTFFDRFPQLRRYERLIDEVRTPDLAKQMAAAEALRLGLLELLSRSSGV